MAHILVVEDVVEFRQMLTQMLEHDGHRVTAVVDGAEAISLIDRVRPDLVVTDILMPKMDGVEFILELGRRSNATPVIAMSGGRRSISPEFTLDSAELLGVRARLAKPFSRAELRRAIQTALN